MGVHIMFHRRDDPHTLPGSMLFEEGDFDKRIGLSYFSAFSDRRQREVYGLSWSDCLTYGPEGDEEKIGPPGSTDWHGWFTPDWERALVRAQKLLDAWEATTDPQRKEYDRDKLPMFLAYVRECALLTRDGKRCQVSIHD